MGLKNFQFFLMATVLLTALLLVFVICAVLPEIPIRLQLPFAVNIFLINYTYLGDSLFVICLAFFIYYYQKQKSIGLQMLVSLMVTLLAVQLIKNAGNPGGWQWYSEATQQLNYSDAEYDISQNLISSHTAFVFTMAGILSGHCKNFFIRLLLLGAAVLMAYSRWHLVQDSLFALMGAMLLSAGTVVIMELWVNRRMMKLPLKKKQDLRDAEGKLLCFN